jgi:hypothetical protein
MKKARDAGTNREKQVCTTHHVAASSCEQHAADMRKQRQFQQKNETLEGPASRRLEHAEEARQERHSDERNESVDKVYSRRAQHRAQTSGSHAGGSTFIQKRY